MNINHIKTVSKYTFYEIYKTNIFLSTLFMGLFICIFTILATKLSFGAVHKVSLDISLGLISLSVKIIALTYGVNLLTKEMEQRTLYIVLSRSVSRTSFLIGKISGLGLILTINTLAIAFTGILSFLFFGGKMSLTIFLSLFSLLIEGTLVLMLCVFFSLFMNKVLCILMLGVVLFSSHFIPEILPIPLVRDFPFLKSFLTVLDYLLPQFHRLNIKNIVLYEESVQLRPIISTLFHSLTYMLALCTVSVMIFKHKDLE